MNAWSNHDHPWHLRPVAGLRTAFMRLREFVVVHCLSPSYKLTRDRDRDQGSAPAKISRSGSPVFAGSNRDARIAVGNRLPLGQHPVFVRCSAFGSHEQHVRFNFLPFASLEP